MSLSETIKCLVQDGYKIKFESRSRLSMTIILSNGRVFTCRDSYTSVMDDEDLRKTLEYMKKELDRSDAEYRKEKNDENATYMEDPCKTCRDY